MTKGTGKSTIHIDFVAKLLLNFKDQIHIKSMIEFDDIKIVDKPQEYFYQVSFESAFLPAGDNGQLEIYVDSDKNLQYKKECDV